MKNKIREYIKDNSITKEKIEYLEKELNINITKYNIKELFYLYSNGEQTLATKVTDYDIIRVDVIVKAGDTEKEISAAVKR